MKIVALRIATKEDIAFIMECESSIDNSRFLLSWAYERHLANLANPNWSYRIIVDDLTNKDVGIALITEVDSYHKNALLQRFAVNIHNCGYGRAALEKVKELIFEEYKFDKLHLFVHPENIHAKHLYESSNFIVEAQLENHYHDCNNNAYSPFYMGIVKNKYFETKEVI